MWLPFQEIYLSNKFNALITIAIDCKITAKPVGQSSGHRESDATILPIMKLKSDNVWVRKAIEKKFINDDDLTDMRPNKNF